MHPGGPREGWEKQFKKKHWEFNFTNDVSLANPEPLQVTDKSQLNGDGDFYSWKETYTYGVGGERISMTYLPAYDANNGWDPHDGTAGAERGIAPRTLWYLNDALGSVVGLIEKDGRMSSRYHYDEFGIPTDAKKFDVNWPGPDNLFGYTGLGYDYYSGLSYARARYYSPELGRFISEDTYKGQIDNPQTLNLYTYVQNNPLKYSDPSGHMAVERLNTYLSEYIGGQYTDEQLVKAVILENGENGIYTSFHEFTQLMSARQIYDSAGSQGSLPVLEQKTKSGEIDIVYNNQIWEVKAKYGAVYIHSEGSGRFKTYRQFTDWEDAEAQLNKYQEENKNFTRGYMIDKIDTIDNGKIGYSLYMPTKSDEKGYFQSGNFFPRNYVDGKYFDDSGTGLPKVPKRKKK
jgi:RHS repeat-associated protein